MIGNNYKNRRQQCKTAVANACFHQFPAIQITIISKLPTDQTGRVIISQQLREHEHVVIHGCWDWGGTRKGTESTEIAKFGHGTGGTRHFLNLGRVAHLHWNRTVF